MWREGNNLFAFNLGRHFHADRRDHCFGAHRPQVHRVVALPGTTSADVLQIDDPYGKGLLDTSARIRGLNASINAQNVDMYPTTPAQDIAAVTPTIAAVGYKSAVPASGQDSIYVDGGTYRLRVTTAGTKTVIFDSAR